jgi:hypothetical protein
MPGAHRRNGLVVQGQDLARIIQHQVARRRQRQAPAIAMEQRLLQQLFQPLDLEAERRLGDEDPFRRIEHRSGVDDRDKAAQEIGGKIDRHEDTTGGTGKGETESGNNGVRWSADRRMRFVARCYAQIIYLSK